jgi:hypothetical protein
LLKGDNNLKNYKHTYAASVPCFIAELFIISLPGIVTLDIALSISDKVKIGTVAGMVLLSFAVLLALGVLFSALLTALINLFKDASVFIDEYNIEYKDIKLNLDSIEYITLFLPEMTSRLSATAQELSIYLNDKEHIVIRRPSIALTAYLKKRCKNAKFEIDHSDRE